MEPIRFIVAALAVSAVVWYINFSAESSRRATERGINSAGTVLELMPNHRHVLVTGGAGFIGSHATLALLDAGHTVTVVDNLSRGNAGALLQVDRLSANSSLPGDDLETLEQAVRALISFDHLVDLY